MSRRDIDLSSEVSDALRDNHASARVKDVLDKWLAEDGHHSSEVIDVPANSKRRGNSK
jgi:hypothetical protein